MRHVKKVNALNVMASALFIMITMIIIVIIIIVNITDNDFHHLNYIAMLQHFFVCFLLKNYCMYYT